MSKKNRASSVSLSSFAALAALLPPTKQVEVVEAMIDNRQEVAVTPPPAPAPTPAPVLDWDEIERQMEAASEARRKAASEAAEAEERRRWAGMTREEYMREALASRSSYSSDPAVRRREMAYDLAEQEAYAFCKMKGVRPVAEDIWGKEAKWSRLLPPQVSPEELEIAAEAAFQATLEAYASGIPEAWVQATGAAQEGRLEEWFAKTDPEHGPGSYKQTRGNAHSSVSMGRTMYCPVIFRGGTEYSVPQWKLATEAEGSLRLTRFIVELWGQLSCPIRVSKIDAQDWAAQWLDREAERLVDRIQNGSTTRALALAFEAVGSTHEEFRGETLGCLSAAKAKALAWMNGSVGPWTLESRHMAVVAGSDAHLRYTYEDSSTTRWTWLHHGDDRNDSRVVNTLEWFILEELGVPYEAPSRGSVSTSEWTPDADSWMGGFMGR